MAGLPVAVVLVRCCLVLFPCLGHHFAAAGAVPQVKMTTSTASHCGRRLLQAVCQAASVQPLQTQQVCTASLSLLKIRGK